MGYASWSVVFGEQPTAAKWNILGTNDSSFNDGTGIANMALNTTALSNPYKFSVYRNAALTPGADTNIVFDTENFDTNNNHSVATGVYTAPVAGFYLIYAGVAVASAPTSYFIATIVKNGSQWKYGNALNGVATPQSTVMDIMQLSASDTVSIQAHMGSSVALTVGQAFTYFGGCLISKT